MVPVRMRFLGALAVAAVASGCGSSGSNPIAGRGDTRADQNPIVLTIATGEGAPIEASGFADAVSRASSGAIEVRVDAKSVQGEGVADYESKVISYVAEGKAQLGYVAARAFPAVGVNSFEPLLAPFLIDSYDFEAAVLGSTAAETLLEGTRTAGVIGLGYVQGALRRPLAYSHPLVDVSDYRGATIGIREGGLNKVTMQALDAVPDVFPPGDPSGLDGMEIDPAAIDLGKYDAGADSLTGNVVFWPRVGVIFANTDAFLALTAAQQALLRDVGRRNLAASDEMVRSWEADGLVQICRRGIRIEMASQAALARLRQATQSVYDEIESDPAAVSVLAAIEQIRESVAAQPDTVTCEGPAETPLPSQAVADSPIVGAWETSYSKEDLQSSPFITDAGELNDDGNWGDFTLTFTPQGRVTFTVRNDLVDQSTSGSYAIDGDHLTLAYDEGENRGETFGARWSVFRDTLTLERIDPEILPTTYLVRAWNRTR